MTHPNGIAEYIFRKGAGVVTSTVGCIDEVIVSNVYDSASNITETLHDDTIINEITYRKNGQLLSISNAYATCVYSHDARGFVTNVAQFTENSLQSSVGHLFDPLGNTTNVELRIGNSELETAYAYDEAERVLTTKNTKGTKNYYTYNQWNGLLASVSNEHITASHTYNILDAVTNTVYRDCSGNALASFGYKQDVLGLITQKVSVIDGVAITNSYTYDNLGRLTSEQINSDAAVSYAYDLAGNRLRAGASTFTYTHNKLNGVSHDSAGNITNMVRGGVTLDLSWNTQGQLISVNTNGVFSESYSWGPLGNRLSTTDSSGTTYHTYDGAQCVADYTANGDLIASYTWGAGIDNLLAVTVYENAATNTYLRH